MKRVLISTAIVAMFTCFSVNAKAQGKAPWTMTYNWISDSSDSNNGLDIEAWIYGKKKTKHSMDEPRTICHGGITIMKNEIVFAYVILNYIGKNTKGYIYNATYKQKGGTPVTGKLIISTKGSIETGPSIKILAMSSELENSPIAGVELIGTPTALDD